MPKNLLQDMVKIKYAKPETPTGPPGGKSSGPNKGTRYALWLVAVVSLVFFLFALSHLFAEAVVTVNPKTKDVILNENLSAGRDRADTLSFDLVVISGEEDKIVLATEEKEISQKAEGIVLFYNTFSSSPQTLNINTKLEGSNGKIYKTQTKTVVPGTTEGGKPGSVEVKIYGAEAGPEYNSVPLDFQIVNFKGTSKYSKFYGRSKGAITNGLKGNFFVLSDSQKANALNELKTALQTKLFKKAADQIPSGFVLFQEAVFLETDDSDISTFSKENMLPLKLRGTFYGLLFDENKLTKKIAQDFIESYNGSEVYLHNIRDLTFSLPAGQAGLPGKENIALPDIKNINFNLSGPAKIVWKLDAAKFADDLLGRSKKDFNQVLLQYQNIDSAELAISPIWKMSLPDNAKDIKVIVNYPK